MTKHALIDIYTDKSSNSLDIGGLIMMQELQKVTIICINDIKLLLNISNTKLKKIINQLSSKDFIIVIKDTKDRTRKLIKLSTKGKKFVAIYS